MVYSDATVVLAYDDYASYAVLQSSLHEAWAWKHGSTLKSDLRYSPTDCFETFPFPQQATPSQRAALERLGEQYHEHRRQIMLARQEGLTKTYNRFHDPAEHSADIAELRRLHVEMDQAVLDAYGWGDVNLDHDFRGEGKEARYALSDGVKEELLRRLLELNFEIAEQESKMQPHRGASREAGGKTKKAGKRDGGKRGKKKSGGEESGSQLGLL